MPGAVPETAQAPLELDFVSGPRMGERLAKGLVIDGIRRETVLPF